MRFFLLILLVLSLRFSAMAFGVSPTTSATPSDFYDCIQAETSVEASVARATRIYLVSRPVLSTSPAPTTAPYALKDSGFGSTWPPSTRLLTFTVVETLKGPRAETLGPFTDVNGTLLLEGEDRLLLFVNDDAHEARCYEHECWYSAEQGWPCTDLGTLSDPKEIVAAIRAAVPYRPKGFALLPVYTAAKQEGNAGSGTTHAAATESDPDQHGRWTYLTVPVDERLEGLAQDWLDSPDRHRRFTGLFAIGYFPSAGNAARVRRFLSDSESRPDALAPPPPSTTSDADPFSEISHPGMHDELGPVYQDVSPWSGSRYYPMRIIAVRTLAQMGMPEAEAPLSDPPHLYHRCAMVLALLLLLPPIGLWFLVRRVSFLNALRHRMAAMALVYACVLTVLIIHSYYRAHVLAFTALTSYYDITLYQGTLRCEALRDFPFPCPISYACFPIGREAGLESTMDGGSLFVDSTVPSTAPVIVTPPVYIPRRRGSIPWHHFHKEPTVGIPMVGCDDYIPGLTFGPLGYLNDESFWPLNGPYAARVVNIPAWPAPLVLSLPASFLFGLYVTRKWRRWSRLKRGLCMFCAYDLRAHKPGSRCPECGGVVT